MLTIEKLQKYGADTQEEIVRCFGNEEFYLNLVSTIPNEKSFDKLRETAESGDLDAAFEAAHALKGVLANLSLTPILDPVSRITELLRSRENTDYTSLINEISEQRQILADLVEN